MDLTFSDDQQAIAELADTIISDTCSPDHLRAMEVGDGDKWARTTWQTLASSGLVGIAIPEAHGGGACGLVEVALIVEAAARAAAPIPMFASIVLGALPITRFGSQDQQAHWLPGVADGSTILTGCPTGTHGSLARDAMPFRATASEDGYRVTGESWFVSYGTVADAFVAPVELPDGRSTLAVVPRGRPGVTTESLDPMNGEPQAIVAFADVVIGPDDILADATGSGDALGWWIDRAVAATCIAQVGTCAGALALTARYVSEREQFGSKLATFQAVSQRTADAYVDTELVRLTAWHALWRLDQDLDAANQIDVAKFFAAEAAQRVVFAAQHLHGGIGVDLDYPVHRYFRWAKELELRLGPGSAYLAQLGTRLAHTP